MDPISGTPSGLQVSYDTLPDGTSLSDPTANTSGGFAGSSSSSNAFLGSIGFGSGGNVLASIPWWAWAILAGVVVLRVVKR